MMAAYNKVFFAFAMAGMALLSHYAIAHDRDDNENIDEYDLYDRNRDHADFNRYDYPRQRYYNYDYDYDSSNNPRQQQNSKQQNAQNQKQSSQNEKNSPSSTQYRQYSYQQYPGL